MIKNQRADIRQFWRTYIIFLPGRVSILLPELLFFFLIEGQLLIAVQKYSFQKYILVLPDN